VRATTVRTVRRLEDIYVRETTVRTVRRLGDISVRATTVRTVRRLEDISVRATTVRTVRRLEDICVRETTVRTVRRLGDISVRATTVRIVRINVFADDHYQNCRNKRIYIRSLSKLLESMSLQTTSIRTLESCFYRQSPSDLLNFISFYAATIRTVIFYVSQTTARTYIIYVNRRLLCKTRNYY
jgi:hypothetical protein